MNIKCKFFIIENIMRPLQYHEKKLLKKTDFINWNVDNNLHEVSVLRRYHIQKREDYTKYYIIILFFTQFPKIKPLHISENGVFMLLVLYIWVS